MTFNNMKENTMNFKTIRQLEVEPFKGVDLNMLFRLEVSTGRMPGYGPYQQKPTLTWILNNPTPDKPNRICIIDIYEVFTPTLLESASFKVELAKWFNGVVDDVLESGDGSWATGMVRTYFSQPQPYGGGYPAPYPGFDPSVPQTYGPAPQPFGSVPQPFGSVPPPFGSAPQTYNRQRGDIA